LGTYLATEKCHQNGKQMRIKSINDVVVPFRPPEIHNDIMKFSMEKYFYFDQDWNIDKRFEVIDDFHKTFESWIDIKLPDFKTYTVNGSTEAITQCLIALSHTDKKIALVKNEYRWYPFIADRYNIDIVWIENVNDLTDHCVFVTSLPFCRDGKVHDLQIQLLHKCQEENIECWLDCAYYGASKPVEFHIPKSVTNIFFSFSKNFGLALNRLGLWYSSEYVVDKGVLNNVAYLPIGNMTLATMLMKKYPNDYLWNNYRDLQLQCTDNPTDLIFMSNDGECLSGKMTEIVREKYQGL